MEITIWQPRKQVDATECDSERIALSQCEDGHPETHILSAQNRCSQVTSEQFECIDQGGK